MISIIDKMGLAKDDANLTRVFNGVLGISVFKPSFTDEVVVGIARLGARICKDFVVLVVDYPERFNGLLYGKDSIEDAELYAKEISEKKQKEYRAALDAAGLNKVEVWDWYRFLGQLNYERNQKILRDFFNSDKDFRKRLITQTVQNISPKIVRAEKRLGRKTTRIERETISNYLLEELGGLFYLFFDVGYPIDIYPSENAPLIDDIFADKFPDLTKALGYDWSRWGYVQVGDSQKS